MECAEYEKMSQLEGTYWWFVGRREILAEFLKKTEAVREPREILEVGCGTGGNLDLLERFGRTTGIDLPGALKWCARRDFDRLVACYAERLACRADAFDVVVCLDVLEHIEDDFLALREMFRVCRPGGYLLLTVPAYHFLWSEHDVALGHYRRYSRSRLLRAVVEAGFKPLRTTYAITFLFLPILLFRLWRKLTAPLKREARPAVAYVQVPGLLSSFFVALLKVEAWLLKRFDLPFGVSLVCLVQKPVQKEN